MYNAHLNVICCHFITSLKHKIVTAAHDIIRQTLTMKKRWRILSLSEHSGKRQLDIYNMKWQIIYTSRRTHSNNNILKYVIYYKILTTNFLCLRYWYWHNSQHGGPLLRLFETSSHFYNENKTLKFILYPPDILDI